MRDPPRRGGTWDHLNLQLYVAEVWSPQKREVKTFLIRQKTILNTYLVSEISICKLISQKVPLCTHHAEGLVDPKLLVNIFGFRF
jgi:hypothetical protein